MFTVKLVGKLIYLAQVLEKLRAQPHFLEEPSADRTQRD